MKSQRFLGWLLSMPALTYMVILFFLPAGFLLVYSFWTSTGFRIVPSFSMVNYVSSISSKLFIDVTLNAIFIGLVTAIVSVALSVPVAYYLTYVARSKAVYYAILLTWFSSYLVRIYAWRTLLGTNGLINTLLVQIGIIDTPISVLLFSRLAVGIALVHIYLPFCVLLVVSSFSEIKKELLEAARDLGTGASGAFWKVIAPNAANGLLGAFTLTFLLASGDYVTPQMLGGTTGQTTGLLIADYFRRSGNWPLGAAQAFIMFAISVAVYVILLFVGRLTGLVPKTVTSVRG
ncbi:ABC transporter permease (plasmid) [Agrobacterium sp. rho-13.3]|uniref:ABC transporter permease n=1 Tax=Agrobacterium sp. rho-13.3 TaxID=3072980 RepID=UPI002A0FAF34|nr:ABC transporter permease [Agrobacterium sp. rho-13.3]MDX8310282.1 ABC transporter permease [Agrobacterium sp. rho-13.3]